MKKTVTLLAAILMLAGTAQATMLTDVVQFDNFSITSSSPQNDFYYGGGAVNRLGKKGDFVRWNHEITLPDTVKAIIRATLVISLKDNEKDIFAKEWATATINNKEWKIGEVDTGKYFYEFDINNLTDYSLTVFLKSNGGDFFIEKSKLTVEYEPVAVSGATPSTAVPEPSTAMLLGSSLLGLGGFFGWKRRKG
ncbi:PEP-CTERM sorting domain-containing protein [Pelotalea chapellei]|uniref:PEP-CTERM sorting domain-containing protein n=1 Tax=Pelotalea chapellei TaxID=44671 RepID=A0ABS5U5F6_9BACT|nr:PEP-CTERM sorting domain-containing protein [Pelotalea chapellei]MBT1070903.1 PEP-CTERM sorting domain-containing protein [Pelotalea chapellei]